VPGVALRGMGINISGSETMLLTAE